MPRPVRPWFRVYVEMFPDRKIRRLTPAQRWLWVALMGAARQSPRPPALFVADDEPMTLAEIADYAGMKEREVGPALEAMVRLGMVTVDEGVVSLPNFTSRQYESDNVTARTREHRERSKDVPKDDVGTFQRSSREQLNVARRNTPETESETDTDNTELLRSSVPGTELAPLAATTAQTIVAAWIDWVPKRPPQQVVGQIAKHVGAMLAEGIDPDDLRRGLASWTTKGLHPSTLPSVVHEVMNASGRSRQQDDTDAQFERAARRLGVAL